MKRSDFLLLAGSTIACVSLLLFTFKIISPKSPNARLAKYDQNSLIIAHEHNYTLDEIGELRNSFSKPIIYTEVLFEESPTKGKYVNKNIDGSRVSYGNSYCDKAPRKRTIWVFGGSTTYGYGVDDNQTISSHLAKELSQRGKQYCVINFGRGYYYSTQELLLYTKLISQSTKKPKYVFFVDGLNDYYHLLGSSFIPKYSTQNPILNAYNKIFHNRFTSKIFGDKFLGITSLPTVPKYCDLSSTSIGDACKTLIKNATQRLINNWETASRLSSAYDISFTPLLQPVPLYKHYFVNPFSKGYVQHRLSGIGYTLMNKEMSSERTLMKKQNFVDASTIFSSPTDSCKMPYVDPVHYSRCGNSLIAKLMSKRVEY